MKPKKPDQLCFFFAMVPTEPIDLPPIVRVTLVHDDGQIRIRVYSEGGQILREERTSLAAELMPLQELLELLGFPGFRVVGLTLERVDRETD